MASNFVKKLDKWCDNQWIVFLCVTATVVAVLAPSSGMSCLWAAKRAFS